jgi:hypothetical protein
MRSGKEHIGGALACPGLSNSSSYKSWKKEEFMHRLILIFFELTATVFIELFCSSSQAPIFLDVHSFSSGDETINFCC